MTPIKFLKRRVGITSPSHESKPTRTSHLPVKVDDSSISTSIASTRTEVTVASDFSDESRQDFQRTSADLAFSDDEDDWRNDFLSPTSAISTDLQGRRETKQPPLSPVASSDAEDVEQPSSPPSPAAFFSEPLQVPSEPSNEKPPGHVRRASSDQIPLDSAPRGHNRHRSMTAVAALQTPPRGHRRSKLSLSPSGARPPTHRRSSSMNSEKFPLPLSPRQLSLESLFATLEMKMQRFGAQHFSVGQTFNLIGNHHFQRQEFDKAILAYESALKCDEGYVEPRDSDHVAAAYGNIGTVCWKTGDIARSVDCFEKVLDLRMESEISLGFNPEQSLLVAASHHQLGLAFSLEQELSKALASLGHALCIREKVLGRKSAEVARTLDAIGKIHLFRGKPDEALQCHKEAYAIKIALTSERDATATASLMNIATAHLARKDYKEAIFTYLAVRNAQSLEMQKATKEGNPVVARLAQAAGETSQMLVGLFTKTKSYSNAHLAVNETLGLYQQAGLKEDHPNMQALKESVKALEKIKLES